MTFIFKLIFVSIIFIFGLVFHLKNHQSVIFNYYINEIQLPLSLLILVSICIGVVLCILVTFPIIIKLKKNNIEVTNKYKNQKDSK